MLTAKVLNSNASLNSFKVVGSIDFIPNTQAVLKLQLWDDAEGQRYVPASGATLNVLVNLYDGTQLTKSATLDANDRSLATVTLIPADTLNLIGGNIQLSLTEGAVVTQGLVLGALQKMTIDA